MRTSHVSHATSHPTLNAHTHPSVPTRDMVRTTQQERPNRAHAPRQRVRARRACARVQCARARVRRAACACAACACAACACAACACAACVSAALVRIRRPTTSQRPQPGTAHTSFREDPFRCACFAAPLRLSCCPLAPALLPSHPTASKARLPPSSALLASCCLVPGAALAAAYSTDDASMPRARTRTYPADVATNTSKPTAHADMLVTHKTCDSSARGNAPSPTTITGVDTAFTLSSRCSPPQKKKQSACQNRRSIPDPS